MDYYIRLLLLLIGLLITGKCQSQQPHEPAIILVDPPARLLENGPSSQQRLPERTCPTAGTNGDPLTLVPAGVPFRVHWRDPDQFPVDLAKLELFSADAGGHLLAQLETQNVDGKSQQNNGSNISLLVKLPAGLRCASCLIRLSVEVDERIQLQSCAQVQVQPLQTEGPEPMECLRHEDCGHLGECQSGQCFCPSGRHGQRCTKENDASFPSSSSSIGSSMASSVQFGVSHSQFHWQTSKLENALRFGLTIPIASTPRWFILGLQSTEADPKCQQAMDQWKEQQEKGRGNGEEAEAEGARANAGVIIRVEQGQKGEAAAAGRGREPSDDDEKSGRAGADDEAKTAASKLNIKKLMNGTKELEKECGPNQRWEQCPEVGRECEPSCDWTAQPELIPSCPARTEQCGQPRCVCTEGFVRLSNRNDECKPFGFCQAPEVTANQPGTTNAQQDLATTTPTIRTTTMPLGLCPINEKWEKCGAACEPSCALMYSEEPCGAACESSGGCTCEDNFVRAQNGRCIQWTECPNLKERIATASNSSKEHGGKKEEGDDNNTSTTPTTMANGLKCNGNETLNECGRVCEADCESIFEREECHQCGQPACSCRQGYARLANGQCIYWGDCPNINSPTTFSTLASNNIIKSSSRHNGQVGPSTGTTAKGQKGEEEEAAATATSPTAATITTTAAAATIKTTTTVTNSHKNHSQAATDEPQMDLCRGQWAWPAGCSGQKCLYAIQWAFDAKTDFVNFTLETRPAVGRKMASGSPIWSGVGFSPSGTLLDADMIVLEAKQGELNGGKLRPMDMHVDEQLEQLRMDRQQDVVLASGNLAGGILRATFARKRRTGDAAGEDLEFGDEGNCFRFLFPVSGGRFEQSGNTTVPVADSLYASDAEICVRQCAAPIGEEEAKKKMMMNGAEEEEEDKDNNNNSCQTEFRWPQGCKEEQCEYLAKWAWEEREDSVQFNISSRGIGRWTGIGFSENGKMPGSDIVTGWVYNGKAYLTDRFAYAQQQPAIDPVDRQDIFDIGGTLEDDIQTISFRRKVDTPDGATDLSLSKCRHYLFPVQGGRVLARSSRDFQQARSPIGFHDQQQPIASTRKICLCQRPKKEGNKGIGEKEGKIGAERRTKREGTKEGGGGNANANAGDGNGGGGGGGPYQCADIAIFQILEGGRAVRVVDAFGLSNDSLRRDELWGGRQSFKGIEVQQNAQNKTMTIWVKKELAEEGGSGNADLTIQAGQIPVFLASGKGTLPVAMGQADLLEFAMVDLMTGSQSSSIKGTTPPTTRTTEVSPSSSVSQPSSTITTTNQHLPISSPTTTMAPESQPSSTATMLTTMATGPPMIGNESVKDEEENGDQQPAPAASPAFQPEAEMATTNNDNNGGGGGGGGGEGEGDAQHFVPNILMDENCFGGFAYPEGCMQQQQNEEGEDGAQNQCQYTVEWLVQPEMGKVHFQLNARMPSDHWTGIGFSTDGAMMNADAIVVLLLADGQISVQDQFSPGYGPPSIDLRQSVEQISRRFDNGLWSVNFSRPLATGDPQDADLRECQHFLFLYSPNPLVPGSGELRKHTEIPASSENRICLGKCQKKPSLEIESARGGNENSDGEGEEGREREGTIGDSITPTMPTTTVEPTTIVNVDKKTTAEGAAPKTSSSAATTTTTRMDASDSEQPNNGKEEENVVQIAGNGIGGGGGRAEQPVVEEDRIQHERSFNIAIRLPNERWNPKLEDTESAEFGEMARKLTDSLKTLISARWPTLVSLQVQKFAEGSVLGLLQASFNGTVDGLPEAKELKEFLQESAAQGMTGGDILLDKEMLEVQEEKQMADEEDKWGPLRELQGWVLAMFGLLLLLCIIGVLFFWFFAAFRNRRRVHQTNIDQSSKHYGTNGATVGMMFNGIHGTGTYQQGHYAPFPPEKDRESETTAKTSTTNGGGGGGQQHYSGGGGKGPTTARRVETPRGIGEATYREWFTKVASKDVPSHYQEHWQMPPPSTPMSRASHHQSMPIVVPPSPYLSYPNDPGFYTLNGEHRIVPPPPAYYRPF